MNLRTSTRPNISTTRDTRSSGPSSPEKVGATVPWLTWCSNVKQHTSTPTRYTSVARRQSKPDQTAWLGRTSFFGLFWLGKRPDLPQQAKLVLHVPRLGDLASLYPI